MAVASAGQVCSSLQTDNHASTQPVSFLQAGCPSCRPTNGVKALKALPLYPQNGDRFVTIDSVTPLDAVYRLRQCSAGDHLRPYLLRVLRSRRPAVVHRSRLRHRRPTVPRHRPAPRSHLRGSAQTQSAATPVSLHRCCSVCCVTTSV